MLQSSEADMEDKMKCMEKATRGQIQKRLTRRCYTKRE
jgi:hypothetical protein